MQRPVFLSRQTTTNRMILPRLGRDIQLATNTNLILAAPLEHMDAAEATGLDVARMIYRIGRGYHLYKAHAANHVKGGLMVLDTDGYTGGGPASALVGEILFECDKRGYNGIVLDIGRSPVSMLQYLTAYLASETQKRSLRFFVPESLHSAGENAVVLIPTALSGGTLTGHIGEAADKYGISRIALEIERVRMDFTLPAANGSGKELSAYELDALIEQHKTQSFFSKDLYAYYFNYRDKKGTHFVLYDNGASIKRKLQAAGSAGVENAFLFYPHVADIIDKIIT